MFLQIPKGPSPSRGGGGCAYGDYATYGGYDDNLGEGGCDHCDDYSSIEPPSESREKNSESEESSKR